MLSLLDLEGTMPNTPATREATPPIRGAIRDGAIGASVGAIAGQVAGAFAMAACAGNEVMTPHAMACADAANQLGSWLVSALIAAISGIGVGLATWVGKKRRDANARTILEAR